MSMMRALYSSVTGLRGHQTAMDVIGDNIANINTVGYKRSRVIFETLLSETISNATAPDPNLDRGGVNPVQIGLGSTVASIDKVFTQGSLMNTDKNSDIAIQGAGFFIYSNGEANFYSRAGNIDLDAQGYFVHGPTGMRLQGYQATRDPETKDVYIDHDQSLGDLNIHGDGNLPGEKLPAMATTVIKYQSNLDASADPFTTHNAAIDVYDKLGNKYSLFVTFTKSNNAPNEWDYEVHLNLKDGQYVADVVNDPTTGEPTIKELPKYYWELDGPDNNTGGRVINDWNLFPRVAEDNGLAWKDATGNITVDPDLEYTLEVASIDTVNKQITFTVTDSQGRQYADYVCDADNLSEYETDLVSTPVAGETVGGAPGTDPGEGVRFDLDYDENFQVGDQVTITLHRKEADLKDVAYRYDFTAKDLDPINETTRDQTAAGFKRGHLVFDPDTGMLDESLSSIYKFRFWPVDNEGKPIVDSPVEITPDFSKVTQFASHFTTAAREQNGYPMGRLQTFNIDENGVIRGVYSNGYKMPIGQIALATFNNPTGLYHEGETMYSYTANSGLPYVTTPNTDGKGKISAGVLEMANVDLSKEFTDMIVTQRGFQANSRVITTADQMLQELVNLKR